MSKAQRTGAARRGPRIRLLPPALIDQIAAGEVVERPASVVKELVENAVDAGATRVRVEVGEGGRGLIAVADDGCGMTPDEARLALQRHATSKLASSEDLRRIGTFGFRGEALPAIASVSRLRLRTRAGGAETGFELRVEGGVVEEERAAGGPEGTRVEVADLFAGVPARRKFLKTAVTEWGHIADWLARAALALPGIHFDVRREDRPALAWPAVSDPLDRIAAVLSEDAAAALVAVGGERGRARLHGFASRPDHHRPTASGIHLFVNGRPVRDRLLRHAVMEIYRDVLPRGRFPTAVLFVEVPLEEVDVNVHPAKWEVRFADPRAIHQLVGRAAREALAKRDWLQRPARVPPAGWPASEIGEPGPGDWLLATPGSPAASSAEPLAPSDLSPSAPLRLADLRLVGQVLETYLVLEGKEGLLLVDQHAAHERVLYERMRAGWLEGGVERQALLITATVELEPGAAAALGEFAQESLRLGFEIEPFGESTVAVRAVPALLAGRDPAALTRALADELRAGGTADAPPRADARTLEAADHALATLACHSARRAGEQLAVREQQALIDALDAIPWAPSCPHGRPVAIPIERPEIERRFGRR